MRKAALHNLGCKVNAYETDSMRRILEEAGYEIVPFEEKADVYVINTCTVTNIADRKSRQMIRRARKRNPDGVVVAAGCYVQGRLGRDCAGADILIGNNRKHELAGLLEEFFRERDGRQGDKGAAVGDIGDISEERGYEELGILQSSSRTRAFMKVQDGCNQFCSYCAIPYARGRVRSRGIKDTVREAESLAGHGCREIVLTGIHLSSYGADFPDGDGNGLLGLIRAVHEVEGISRIRLGSLEPRAVTEDFAAALSELPKVCPHFHLSLQSGCDATLRRMNRRYSCREYEESCEALRRHFPHPALTTDVIVGFPGETEEEFRETRAFLREIGFFEMHIFKYSAREGTRAAKMGGQVAEETKSQRSAALMADAAPMKRDFLEWHIGKEVEVLVEETLPIGGLEHAVGHTREYVKAELQTGPGLENHLVKARARSLRDGEIVLEGPGKIID